MAEHHQLFLLRHAKSSWDDDELDDHDRPLAPRGEDAVERIRRHIELSGIAPELVLCSSARRTVMTLDGIAAALPDDVEISVEDELYGASAGRLLAHLRTVDDDVATVMLIGHNPGIEDLASELVGGGDDELRQRLEAKFPTAALATLRFDGPWRALAPGSAVLEGFVIPRQLR